MTLEELASVQGEILTCEQIADVLGSQPHTIRTQAKNDPASLGFPVIIIGNRVKIPKRSFLAHMGVK